MKLLENIVKNVPRTFIEPAAAYFAQDTCYSGENGALVAQFYQKPSVRQRKSGVCWGDEHYIFNSRMIGLEASEDAETTVVTREELMRAYDLVEEGYTLWFGGDCPVEDEVMVTVVTREGFRVVPSKPRTFHWSNLEADPIVAYKVVSQERPSQGVKHDSGKPRFSLLPLKQIWDVEAVLEFGAKKYQFDNWKKVDDSENRYFDAAIRHIFAWRGGEKLDPETNLPHLAHAVCCLLFLMWGDDQ